MIAFPNAKINIGLDVTARRADGYHILSTFFYPVGRHNGTAVNPQPFNDVLELADADIDDTREGATSGSTHVDYCLDGLQFSFRGRPTQCAPQQNLVVKAAATFLNELKKRLKNGNAGPSENNFWANPFASKRLVLVKNIPDGAGMGGGSADASFTLRMLNSELPADLQFTYTELEAMALTLGADCPMFIANVPAYAEGIGEKLTPMPEILKGWWCVVAKPPLHISTREAFANIHPSVPDEPLPGLLQLPVSQWRGRVKNDFERSLFPAYPVLPQIKDQLYDAGAEYASMTGSGAALYGLFPPTVSAEVLAEAKQRLGAHYVTTSLL